MDVQGARVLVTGASSGIGAGLAERFAAEGAIVGVTGRDVDRLTAVLARCRQLSPESRHWVCDLAQPAEVDRLAAAVIDAWGGVDVLVNNAGIPKRRHVMQLDIETVEAVTNVNFLAPVRLTLALLPSMVAKGGGRIVNVSSVAAVLSSPGETAYDASKAALSVFSEAMAIDLWTTGVKVMVVYPGVVDTPLFDVPGNDPLPPVIEKIGVDEAVDAVFAGLEDDACEVYVPAWFKDIAVGKASNLPGFLSGSAQFVAEQAGNG